MQKALFPGYTVGSDAYEDIVNICPAYGKRAAIIGGKLKVGLNADELLVTSSSALCMKAESIDGIPVGGKDPQRLKLLQNAYLEKFQRETAR